MKKLLIFTVVVALTTLAAPVGAADIPLLTSGATGTITASTGGVALFTQGANLSGSGVFPAFVQVGGNDTINAAYNTTVNGVGSNGNSDTFNHEITLSQVTQVTVDNVLYYEFLLDINENKNDIDRYLSLDDLRVYTSDTANQSSVPFPADPGAANTLVWAMPTTGEGEHILLDYSLEPGSGRADMSFRVRAEAFGTATGSSYVYLYSQFGVLGTTSHGGKTGADWGASAGFEEWAYNIQTISVPDGGITAFMLGLGMLGLGVVRRFRR